MGKIQFITQEQQLILDEIKHNEFLTNNFYFTGGTALSSIYLHHRYSDDIDFFSPQKLDTQTLFALLQQWSQKHHFTFQSRFAEVVYISNLHFPNQTDLKLDFGYYPYPQIEKPASIENIPTDSLLDIAINKLLTISQRTEVKDFVDLYFLLQKYSVWDLIEGVKQKFHTEIEPLLLGADFLKAEDFEILPKMIKPLSLEDLKIFFRQKAQKIGIKSTN